MAYATIEDLTSRINRELSSDEETVGSNLLEDASVIIDSFAPDADAEIKKLVSVRMVMRSLGDGDSSISFPVGTTQGSMAALGYSQSFTVGTGGSVGELYLSKLEKQMLGIVGNTIGSYSPVQEMVCDESWWNCHD